MTIHSHATAFRTTLATLRGWFDRVLDVPVPVKRRSNRVRFASLLDRLVRVRRGRWVFVSKRDVPINGNLRAVLDEVVRQRQDVAVYCEGAMDEGMRRHFESCGVRVLQGFTLRTVLHLLGCETVVVSHSVRDAFISRRKRGRLILNVWHGVALKRIEALMPVAPTAAYRQRQSLIRQNGRLYDALLASNAVDRIVNAAAFAVPFDKVHAIGLPRFDYFRSDYPWPADLLGASARLATDLAGRRLLLYAPTFREHGTRLADLLPADAARSILDFCALHGLMFGLRPHPYQQAEFDRDYRELGVLDLGMQRYAEPAVVLRQASWLVTDYSSIWVDFLFTGRPLFGFCPDLATYVGKDRDFIYDYEELFPGPIASTWNDVLADVARSLEPTWTDLFVARREQATRLLLPRQMHPRCISDSFVSIVVRNLHRHQPLVTHCMPINLRGSS